MRESKSAAVGSNLRDEVKEGDRKEEEGRGRKRKVLWYALTISCFLVEVTRRYGEGGEE